MAVRYEGGTHSLRGFPEPDLVLTDKRELVVRVAENQPVAYMGVLTTLVAWHLEDPPDERERRRNHVVYGYQGNRNPFIDRPADVCRLWPGEACPAPVFLPHVLQVHR